MPHVDAAGARSRMRRSLIDLTVATVAATTLAGTLAAGSAARSSGHRACRGSVAPVSRFGTAAVRRTILCLLNRERSRHGLGALHERRALDRAAQRWTDTMAATGTFAHSRFFAARIAGFGYRFSAVGENIATGFPTPREVVRGWMRSRGHCENILTAAFTDVGIGLSQRAVPGVAAGAGTWTVDLGLPRGHRASRRGAAAAAGCPYAG